VSRNRTASIPLLSNGRGATRWALVGLLLAAWALRLPSLLEMPLHPDEALYGYWGLLIGQGRDPWLTGGSIYKPPLLPYLVSVFQLVFGSTTLTLRLPGVTAGMIMVPLVGALAHGIYEDVWTGVGAMVAVALSPFAIELSGTAFPDPPMVMLGLGACVAAARGRARWAGLLAGLSFATKQTGLVWLPLVFVLSMTRGLEHPGRAGGFVVAYLIPALLTFAWDGIRVALGADSFWLAGIEGYGGLRLIWPQELWPRLRAWIRILGASFESKGINAVLVLGVPLLGGRGLVRPPATRRAFFDALFTSYCLIYMLLHWLVAFPLWGRYILPVVPMLALLLGRVVRVVAYLLCRRVKVTLPQWLGPMMLALLLVVPAGNACAGGSALAADRVAYRGIEDVVLFFAELPEGSVVYHHWLGWHYRYMLFDAPVYLAYWPTPAWLARDVQAFGDREPRYIAFPAWESAARVEHSLDEVGYRLQEALSVARGGTQSFVVYRIVPTSDK